MYKRTARFRQTLANSDTLRQFDGKSISSADILRSRANYIVNDGRLRQKKLTKSEQKARIRAQKAEFLTGVRPTFPPPKKKRRKGRAADAPVAPKEKRPRDRPPEWEVRLRLDKEVRERKKQPPPAARPGLVKRKDLG